MKKYQYWKGFPKYVLENGCAYTGKEQQAERSNQPAGSNSVINFIIL